MNRELPVRAGIAAVILKIGVSMYIGIVIGAFCRIIL